MRSFVLGVVLLFGVVVTTAQDNNDLGKEYVRMQKRVDLLVQQNSNYMALSSELHATIVDIEQQDTLARAIASNHEEKINAILKKIEDTQNEANQLREKK